MRRTPRRFSRLRTVGPSKHTRLRATVFRCGSSPGYLLQLGRSHRNSAHGGPLKMPALLSLGCDQNASTPIVVRRFVVAQAERGEFSAIRGKSSQRAGRSKRLISNPGAIGAPNHRQREHKNGAPGEDCISLWGGEQRPSPSYGTGTMR